MPRPRGELPAGRGSKGSRWPWPGTFPTSPGSEVPGVPRACPEDARDVSRAGGGGRRRRAGRGSVGKPWSRGRAGTGPGRWPRSTGLGCGPVAPRSRWRLLHSPPTPFIYFVRFLGALHGPVRGARLSLSLLQAEVLCPGGMQVARSLALQQTVAPRSPFLSAPAFRPVICWQS